MVATTRRKVELEPTPFDQASMRVVIGAMGESWEFPLYRGFLDLVGPTAYVRVIERQAIGYSHKTDSERLNSSATKRMRRSKNASVTVAGPVAYLNPDGTFESFWCCLEVEIFADKPANGQGQITCITFSGTLVLESDDLDGDTASITMELSRNTHVQAPSLDVYVTFPLLTPQG